MIGKYEYRDPSQAEIDRYIDPTSAMSVSRSLVGYLRTHPREVALGSGTYELPNSRYTEVHVCNGEPMALPAPRPSGPYGASVGGYHSVLDELRSQGEAARYPHLMQFADHPEHRLGFKTMAGKGLTRFDAGDAELSILTNTIRMRSSITPGRLRARLEDRLFQLGYTSLTFATERAQAARPIEPGLRVRSKVSLRSLELPAGTEEESPYTHQGIITLIDAGPKTIEKSEGVFVRERALNITGIHACVKTHEPIYQALKLQGVHMQQVDWDGGPVDMAVNYTVDTRTGIDIHLIYDQDYEGREQGLGFEVAHALAEQLQIEDSVQHTQPVQVSVSVPGKTPSFYTLQ